MKEQPEHKHVQKHSEQTNHSDSVVRIGQDGIVWLKDHQPRLSGYLGLG